MAKLNWTKEQIGNYIDENAKLIHSAIKQYNFPGMEYADIFQIACIGVLKALETYDTDNKSALSTYVVTCARNQVLYETRKSRAKSRTGITLSYEGSFMGNDGRATPGVENMNLREIDLLHNHVPMEEIAERNEQAEIVTDIMNRYLTEKERKLIYMHIDGSTQSEIAKSLDLAQANISRMIRQIRCKILLHMRRCGYNFD